MKLIAENQLVGTHGGFAVFRNLYEKPDGSRVSVKTSREFETQRERTLPDGRLTQYPPQAKIFAKHKL